MHKNTGEKISPITDIKLSRNWDKHIDSVRSAIKKLDLKQAKSVAQAPFIGVSNSTK
jgi:hypothetical protein